MKNILLILLLASVLIVSALFFAQNDGLVEINYFGGTIEWPLNWILILALLIGIVIGVSLIAASWLSLKLKLANTNRRLAKHN